MEYMIQNLIQRFYVQRYHLEQEEIRQQRLQDVQMDYTLSGMTAALMNFLTYNKLLIFDQKNSYINWLDCFRLLNLHVW